MRRLLLVLSMLLCSIPFYAQDSLETVKLGLLPYSETINDVWGYEDNGKEYALVGVNTGFSIVDVTVPSTPLEKHFIAGANTIWRDIKTYSHYAYVVHDGVGATRTSDGILIVDLNTVDSTNISYTQFFPTVTEGGTSFAFRNAHNIYIDNGVLYLFGSNISAGGACLFDLTQDPNNPTYLGIYDGTYYHDGVVRNDTLYGAAINLGVFEIVDVTNKAQPIYRAAQATPNNFCHNVWFSDDNKTLFTTDERRGAFITSYDISDFNNITELDRIRTSIFDADRVIPHNTHVLNDFLVTSYYTSGLQIVDASQPDILIETAYYDTSLDTGDGFTGAWGAYPYLPSGNILVSDRQQGLFVLSSSYPRACFFTAFVKDSVTKNAIPSADVIVVKGDISGETDLFGNFRSGRRDTGDFLVVIEKPGYHTDTLHLKMRRGVVQHRNVALLPLGFSINENGVLANQIDVFPNPTSGALNVSLQGIEDPKAQLEIWDMSGRLHYTTMIEIGSGELSFDPGLDQGIYLLRVTNGDLVYATRRLVVSP